MSDGQRQADEIVANLFGVTADQVECARFLKDAHPDLYEECRAGRLTLDQAACRVVIRARRNRNEGSVN